MLHVMRALCVARNLHTFAPGPLERACWKQFAGSEEIVKNLKLRRSIRLLLLLLLLLLSSSLLLLLLLLLFLLLSLKVNNYFAFDSGKPLGSCVKSKINSKEHEFFSIFL